LISNRFTRNGGPVHWIHENYACPNCVWDTVDNAHHLDCCTNKPAEQFCCADNNRTSASLISEQILFLPRNEFLFFGIFFDSFRCETNIFCKHLWMLVKLVEKIVYIVELHVKLRPKWIQIVEMRAKSVL
jgi:hypothetical protein